MPQAVFDKYLPSAALRSSTVFIAVVLSSAFVLGVIYLAAPGSYFLLGVGAAITLAAIFFKPEYGFYLIMLLYPVDMTQLYVRFSGTQYLLLVFPYIFVLVPTILSWMIFRMAGKRKPGLSTPVSAILPIMVLCLLVTIIWAPLHKLALALGVSLILNYGLFYLTTGVIRDRQTLDKAVNAIIILGLITAAGVILSQWESYKDTLKFTNSIGFTINFGEMHDRPAGFGTVDNMGGILSLASFVAMGRMMAVKTYPRKFFYFSLALVMAVGMILTVSRGALVGYVAGIFFLLIIHPSTKNKVIKYGLISIFLLSSTILIAKPSYIDRLLIGLGYTGELYFTEGKSVTTSNYNAADVGLSGMDSRKVWWQNGFNEMLKHEYKLIIGLGIGGFIYYGGTIGTHSVPLSFFFDMGVIGAVILIFFAVSLGLQLYHHLRNSEHSYAYFIFLGVLTGFFAEVVVHGLIDYDFFSYTARMFWFPLALVCAVLNVVKSEQDAFSKEEGNA